MRLLAVGPLWRGSNAGGLFHALSRQGCIIEVVDEFYFISLQTKTRITKIAERIIRPLQEQEFNNAIKSKISSFMPDVLLVYKGAFVRPETLLFARDNNCRLALFYPDVSMTNHGANIPRCIPLYDIVFTTKTFGIKDMEHAFGVKRTFFIPHGFDPEIHRLVEPSARDHQLYDCDVSFIGTWSPKKEQWLSVLKERLPGVNLKIWGEQWGKATAANIRSSIQGRAITGDLYATAINCSKINLGILSEKVTGASSGDLITSRTFHIPGAGGFMLHERNEEAVLYYNENEEAAFFDGPEEMAQRVSEFLNNDPLREKIRLNGYKRAQKDHSLDARAQVVIKQLALLQ